MSIPWWFPLCFLKEQWVLSLHHPTTSFSGQTIIITGANSGIGLEAARHFVKLNASKIILAVHSAEKGELAKADLQNSLCTPCTTSIEIWPLDLCSFNSVKQFSKRAQKELPRLNTLLCNAGIHALHWNIVEATGHETTITTNVLSPFILALLLFPLLKATAEIHNAQTRLTFAESEMHFASTFSGCVGEYLGGEKMALY